MKLKLILAILVTMTTTLFALPMQAQAKQLAAIQPVQLTPRQKAELKQIHQQFQARYDQILTPEQLRLRKTVQQNPNDPKALVALLKSFSPQQRRALQSLFAQANQEYNAIYTPQQQWQFQHNIEARIAELKAEKKLPSTYQYGPWQPVARINPTQATQLKVINETNIPLQYGLTTDAAKTLLPGLSADLNDMPLPENVLIYPAVSSASLKYDVTTWGNTAIVRVRPVGSDTPGDGSIIINQTGAIYVY
jgi:Spy/CpxP family protein refolding chaperone